MQNAITNTNITKLSKNKQQQLTKKLIDRFNYDKIINQQHYIKNMSPNLSLRIDILLKDQLFNGLTNNLAQQIIKDVPFFKINKLHIKVQYENSQRVLIIAGIKREVVKQWLDLWCKQYLRRNMIVKQINLGYWHIVQFCNQEWAMIAKKFFRSKKVQRDEKDNQRKLTQKDSKKQSQNCYKFPCRRVRIVLLNQDFFTVLYDQIHETMNEKFSQAIQTKNECILVKDVMYISLYGGQRIQDRQEQIDDGFSSQFLSQTQSAHDSIRMKQIDVQTSNQGTQMELTQNQLQMLLQIQTQTQALNQLSNQNQVENQIQIETLKSQLKNKEIQGDRKIQKIGNIEEWYPPKVQQSQSSVQNDQLQVRRNSQKIAQDFLQQTKISTQIHKNRTNSACFPHSYQHHLLQSQNHHITKPKHNRKPQKTTDKNLQNSQQQFPTLNQNINNTNQPNENPHNKSSITHQEQQKSQDTNYSRLQFIEIKKKLNQFIRQGNNNFDQSYINYSVPDYIRKQSQKDMYYRKFLLGVMGKSQKAAIKRKILNI